MNRLPVEVLLEIFTNLELEDLFSATGVCVKWHWAVCHMLATKRRTLVIREGAPVVGGGVLPTESVAVINKRNFSEPLKQFSQGLKHLFIVYEDNGITWDPWECLDSVLKSAVNLISLNLIGSVRCTRQLITSIIQNCSDTIQTVWLQISNKGSDNDRYESEVRESLHLIENQMYGINLRETKITVAEPRKMTSKVYGFYTLPTVEMDLTVPYNLSEIYLLNCCGLDETAYNGIRLAKNVRALTLRHARNLDANGVQTICELPHLQVLSVSDAVRVTEDGWKCVFTQCTSLTVLKLKNCAQLSDSVFCCDTVEVVCSNLLRLKLDLENCKRVTSVGVSALLLACRRLNSLSLSVDCDEETLETLRRCSRRLSSSLLKITVQTALAAVSTIPVFESLSRDCSFVVERTKIIIPSQKSDSDSLSL